jgi:hypothetical protein
MVAFLIPVQRYKMPCAAELFVSQPFTTPSKPPSQSLNFRHCIWVSLSLSLSLSLSFCLSLLLAFSDALFDLRTASQNEGGRTFSLSTISLPLSLCRLDSVELGIGTDILTSVDFGIGSVRG